MERLKAWREIAQKIAHEIKNPLTPIRLTIEHLITLYKDNPKEFDRLFSRATENILEQVDNLRDISDEFSSFGRLQEPKKKEINLSNILNETILFYIGRCESEGIKMESDIEDGILFFGDERMMKRVFINLIDNAMDSFIDVKGIINIRLKKNEDESIVIFFEDNGVGIKSDNMEKVFEPNFSTKKAGMGIGLGIVKEILEKHNGIITINSTEGNGTTVKIILLK
ncbi:MAG: ATP-binding protein, partial [bacterium]|nr:ATP-binding protein [bacterium]